jgi:hypoxanthine phosphoribosyltransferase
VTYDDHDFLRRYPFIDRVLIPSADIQRRVKEIGNELSNDYRDTVPILICILKGAFTFLADLSRCLMTEHEIDFMAVSSYEGGQTSTGIVKIEKDLKSNITARDVVVVEDIIDTGLTINYLSNLLATRAPRSIRVCALLDKVPARTKEARIDYRGFEIPNEYVIGYGLDYNEMYRHLPFIGTMRA